MEERIGKVLRIEKTSIHDGEGLRTVVFLKGCPLRCKWCSTPESQKMECEMGYGTDMSVSQVVKEVCKDEIFFFHSGGGITISGGEVLMQAEFAKDILKRCNEEGISTAIETSLYGPYEVVKKLLPYLDAVYVDFKLFQEQRHLYYTGVSNCRIKENLLQMSREYAGEIHVRIPTIPGVNMSRENMEQSAAFLKSMAHVNDVELLPHHKLGMDTYGKLGKIYEMKDTPTPTMDEMEKMADVWRACVPSLKVKIKGKPVV